MERQGTPAPQQRRWFAWCSFGNLLRIGIALLIPAFVNFAAMSKEDAIVKPPGVFVDIGAKQRLYIHCVGEGEPVVLLDAPTGMSSDAWRRLHSRIAEDSSTRVCTYDRAGIGYSDRPVNSDGFEDVGSISSLAKNGMSESAADGRRAVGGPYHYTSRAMVDDVSRLLRLANVTHPIVYVGAEVGAINARLFQLLHGRRVAGTVLVTPLDPALLTVKDGAWAHHVLGHEVPKASIAHLFAASGLARLAILAGVYDPVPEDCRGDAEVAARYRQLACRPTHAGSAAEERYFLNESLTQLDMLEVLRLSNTPATTPDNHATTLVVAPELYDGSEAVSSPANSAYTLVMAEQTPLKTGQRPIVVPGTCAADILLTKRGIDAVATAVQKVVSHVRLKHPTVHKHEMKE